jgi:hypothetical protein
VISNRGRGNSAATQSAVQRKRTAATEASKSDSLRETLGACTRTLARDRETLDAPQETLDSSTCILGDSATCILGDSATCTQLVETAEDGDLVQSGEDYSASSSDVAFGAPQSAAYAANQKMHSSSPALLKTVVLHGNESAPEAASGVMKG